MKIGIGLICRIIFLMVFNSCVLEEQVNNAYVSLELLEHNMIPLADPYILVDEGMYFAYGTQSASVGYYVWKSHDLVNWEMHPELVLHKNNVIGESGFWAPEVYCMDNKYYMYYCANNRPAVALSKSPLGPFIQQHQEWLTTKWGGIDCCIYTEGDKSYFYFVDEYEKNRICVLRLKSDKTSVDEQSYTLCIEPSQAWELDNVNEGPTIVKIGKKYIMTYSGRGYFDPGYGVGVAVADDPMGPWEKYEGNPVMQYPVYKGAVLQGTGHNSLFKDLDGNWRMVFHAHSAKGIEGGRYMYIVSVDLLDHPPYIVFHDDLFAPVLAEEDATEGSAGTK